VAGWRAAVYCHAWAFPVAAAGLLVPVARRRLVRAAPGVESAQAQREPHWNVTVLVPSALVTMLDVIGCEPYFRQ
jgi:hypothetical protein